MPSLTRTSHEHRTSHRVGGRHLDCSPGDMRVVGRVPLSGRVRSDCDQPLRAVCRSCDHAEEWRCGSYGCGPCGETKRRQLQRVIEDGCSVQVAAGLYGHFITVTAPGKRAHLRWWQGRRPGSRPACGCHEHGMSDGEWNRQESKCWNRLRTALARRVDTLVFAGSIETQKRGLLHRHVVVFASERLHFSDLQDLALAAGYGCVLDVEPLDSPQKAARYISKYASKGAAQRPEVPWSRTVVDQDTGELREVPLRATYRLWSSSQKWGVTLKQLRTAASLQARARARYLEELTAALAADSSSSPERPALAAAGSDPPT